MSKIWFISDTHFSHLNILKYCSRPFKDIEEMNEQLIQNWNSVIKFNDIVWHLGDLGFGTKDQIHEIVERLEGRKSIILGNHDNFKPSDYLKMGFEFVSRFPVIYDKFIILSHEPVFLEENSCYGNFYGHLHQNNYIGKNTNYFNCSVEQINYIPISFNEIKKRFK
jgi:calcineurin-like phosphoesterase family protein